MPTSRRGQVPARSYSPPRSPRNCAPAPTHPASSPRPPVPRGHSPAPRPPSPTPTAPAEQLYVADSSRAPLPPLEYPAHQLVAILDCVRTVHLAGESAVRRLDKALIGVWIRPGDPVQRSDRPHVQINARRDHTALQRAAQQDLELAWQVGRNVPGSPHRGHDTREPSTTVSETYTTNARPATLPSGLLRVERSYAEPASACSSAGRSSVWDFAQR